MLPLSKHQQIERLYMEHHGWLLAWLKRTLGCSHHAADTAQTTFVKLLDATIMTSQIASPRAWLKTTAKRILIDEYRHHKIESLYLHELAHQLAQETPAPSAEASLMVIETIKALSNVLESVSANASHAFIAHYIEGKSQVEIAQTLGVSTKMVQKYLIQVLLKADSIGISKP